MLKMAWDSVVRCEEKNLWLGEEKKCGLVKKAYYGMFRRRVLGL